MSAPGGAARSASPSPSLRQLRRRIAARFSGRGVRGYVRGKLWLDPLYAAAAAQLGGSSLPLLDLGCGLGLLGHWLAGHGQRAPYLGVDSDVEKIALAQAAAQAHMRFLAQDATAPPEFAGNVALMDLLVYLDRPGQQAALAAAAARVAPGGVLLARTGVADGSWRHRCSSLAEKLLARSGWMPMAGRGFPTAAELDAPLRAAGLTVRLEPCWGRTPYNNHLVVATRPSRAA